MKIDRKSVLFYLGVCLALLPIIMYRDFTPSNELRYLSIADEALSNHTFFAFTNHGIPYADKPPLYLWIVMLCRWVTGGHHMWLLSLFSLLPALGVVRIMDRWAGRELDGALVGMRLASGADLTPGAGGGSGWRRLTGLMLVTSGYFIGAAVTLRMDMLMCLFIVLSLKEFWNIREISSKGTAGKGLRRSQWLFPVWLFLALFTKGPYGILIPLFCTLVYLVVSREIRSVFRYWGWRTWLVLIVLCVLWFGAVYIEGGKDYLNNLLFHQTVGRAVNSFHHKAPFYYYAVCIWYCIAPWSLLAVGAGIAALRPKWARTDLQRFFLSISVTTFVLLSCFSSKLQIYLLPAFPFMIYAAALCLPKLGMGNVWMRIALTVPASIFALAGPAMLFVATMPATAFLNEWTIHLAAWVLTLTGVYSLYSLWHKRRADKDASGPRTAILATGVGMLLALFVCGWALPEVNPQLGYGALCDKAAQLSQEYGIEDIHTWRISRPENMDVYLHRDVTIEPNEEEPTLPEPCLLLTRVRYLDNFPGLPSETVGPYAVIVCR